MAKNSHIQVTQSLMRGFSFSTKDGDKVKYLDLTDNEIKEEKVRLLGSQKFYYDEDAEEYLAKIESDFGHVIYKIKLFSKNKLSNIELNSQDLNAIKNFFEYSLKRDPRLLKEINKDSISSKILGNLTPSNLIRIVYEDKNFPKYFDDFSVNVLINNTNIGFILPSSVYYPFKKHNYNSEMYILPVNGKTSIVLIHNNDYSKFIDEKELFYLKMNDEPSIKFLNEAALKYSVNQDNSFVIGEISELERLQKIKDI